MLTAERLHEILNYDEVTGIFTCRITRGRNHTADAGMVAGSDSHGYIAITIDGRKYLAHRLAWLYVNGIWPENLIDHINLNRRDNRFSNLREATHSTNKANRFAPANNTSGLKGVSFNKAQKKYQASICRQYKQMHLGFFDTAEKAHAAYCEAHKSLFGEFSRTV